ncbi:hypothetical protein [Asanoa hainanensis]|uniref:hypothetical protein n=1 Tax=Asanoa hainanensis TaxID=560556 RepID=UPI00117CD54E|nr:hypothetical protein [Asanoa hainanensis]
MERLAYDAMGGGARVADRLAELTTAMRSAADGDAELDAALEPHADRAANAIEVLAGNDPAKVDALDTDAVEASEAAVRKLCADPRSPSPAAADQALVRTACAKVTALEEGDGVKAADLFKSMLGGLVSAADRAKLAGLLGRMSEGYDELYWELPVDGTGPFRNALFQVGSAYDIAAYHLEQPDGVTQARDHLAQKAVRSNFATVHETCGVGE